MVPNPNNTCKFQSIVAGDGSGQHELLLDLCILHLVRIRSSLCDTALC